MKKKTIIVSDYSGTYERVYTIKGYFIFLTKLAYLFKGMHPYKLPFEFVYQLHRFTGFFPYQQTWVDVEFEYYVPGTDQITHNDLY
jgi:hypothetical protein